MLYDGTEMTVGPTAESEIEPVIQGGGRRGEFTESCERLRDRYGDQIRARFPRIPRRVSGFNLDELLPEQSFDVARALVGTEGTCAIVLQAKLRLIPSPQHRALVGVGYKDAFVAADDVPEVLNSIPLVTRALREHRGRSPCKGRTETRSAS